MAHLKEVETTTEFIASRNHTFHAQAFTSTACKKIDSLRRERVQTAAGLNFPTVDEVNRPLLTFMYRTENRLFRNTSVNCEHARHANAFTNARMRQSSVPALTRTSAKIERGLNGFT